MDALELLRELGQVEPADQAVIDSALHQLAETVGQDTPHIAISSRMFQRRGLITAAAVSALAVAGTVAIAGGLAHSHSPAPVGVTRSASARDGGVPRVTPGAGPVTAILTAFSASSNDILMVTKTMSGDYGTLGPTVMWLSPVGPVPGTTVRSRILSFSLAGARQADQALTYPASAPAPATASPGCGTIFSRPRIAVLPSAGVRGTLTAVSYRAHVWAKAPCRSASGHRAQYRGTTGMPQRRPVACRGPWRSGRSHDDRARNRARLRAPVGQRRYVPAGPARQHRT